MCDVSARVGYDGGTKFLDLFARGLRPDHHAITTALVGGLDDEIFEIFQNEFPVGFLSREVGLDIRQDRILTKVKFDHRRHIVVGHFVVGDARAKRIAEVHIALAVSVDDAGNAEHGVLAENGRVQKIIIDTAVDDIDLFEPLGGFHVNAGVLHHKVLTHHDFDAHRARKKRMLEVGGVVNAGSKNHHRRVRVPLRSYIAQHFKKLLRVAVYRTHRMAAEQLRKNPLHRLPVFEQIGNT